MIAGMTLQQDCRRAEEPSKIAVPRNGQAGRRVRQDGSFQLFLYDRTKPLPARGDLAGNENQLWRKSGSNQPQAPAQCDCLTHYRFDRCWIILLDSAEQTIDIDRRMFGIGFVVETKGRTRRPIHLPAAAPAAAAYRTRRVDRDMPEFASKSVKSGMHLTTGKYARADSLGYRNEYGTANPRKPSVPGFSEQARVRVVVHLHLQLQSFLQSGANVEVFPVQVRCQQETLSFRMNATRHADTDSLKGPVGVTIAQHPQTLNDAFNRSLCTGHSHHCLA